jgi:carbamoyltransferase
LATAVLGVNAVFHDSAAALALDGEIVFAAEEERFSRRKHGKEPVALVDWDSLAPRLGDGEEWTPRHADLAASVQARLGAATYVAEQLGSALRPMRTAALGHRSLLADPRNPENLERLNDIKGREQFRPVAPMVLGPRAAAVFDGPLPSPYMLFTHRVRPDWIDRIPAAVHVDGTARIQTVDPSTEPLLARMLVAFERSSEVPVVINTSLNTAGRPMVDDPRDALECFGSAPIEYLAIGPFLISRAHLFANPPGREEVLVSAE